MLTRAEKTFVCSGMIVLKGDLIDYGNPHEMADHTNRDTHTGSLSCDRTAVNRVARLAHQTAARIVERLENSHGHNGFLVALVTNMDLGVRQHCSFASMSRMAIQTGELLFMAFKTGACQKTMPITGIDGTAPEQFLVEMALSALFVLPCLGEVGGVGGGFFLRVLDMNRLNGMAGAAFPQMGDLDELHGCGAGVFGFFPALILRFMTALTDFSADRRNIDTQGLSVLILPGSGAPQ